LRLFAVISFGVFVIAAMLAFSVRPPRAERPVTRDEGEADAGSLPLVGADFDAGPPRLEGSSDIATLFGGTGDRSYLAGSKAFGAPVAPQGFGGLGLRGGGGGDGLGIGGLGGRTPQVVDVVVRGSLSTEAARALATSAASVKFAEEPCLVRPGVFVLELAVSSAGRVDRARELPVDGGFVRGAECVAERAKRRTVPKGPGPSTVLITYQVPGRSAP